MNIGLYGGSFNPTHNEHVAVVKEILNQKIVDEVWVVPCKNHAFKKDLVSVEDRLTMLNYAFAGMKNVRLDLTEVNSNKTNYTSETLEELKQKHNHTFYLIVGVDALNDLNEWHDSSYLKDNAHFISLNRKGYVLNSEIKDTLKNLIALDNVSFDNLSSTKIRERIATGKSIEGLVNKEVENYIMQRQLYQNNEYFVNPAATVDLIVHDEKGIVLIKRKNNPFKDYWALPGGYLDCGKETLEAAAVRELREETSLIADINDLELVGVYSEPGRDPRGHVISHAFVIKKYSGIPVAADDAKEIGIFETLPEKLAFDHAKILGNYYKKKSLEK